MISERNNFVNIREILSRVTRHPMLKSVDLEQAIQYTIDFISIVGMPTFYMDKLDIIPIMEYRGLLPCDLVSITQVKDLKTHTCLRSMTDTFSHGLKDHHKDHHKDIHDKHHIKIPRNLAYHHDIEDNPIPHVRTEELTFKTQGRIIFTSFRTGKIELLYKAIPVDEDGLPLLIDNANFLKALELYIKKQVFTIMFDLGKLQSGVLQNTQQEYAWAVAQCEKEFIMPSISEMETITRMWNTLIPNVTSFDGGFKNLGNREYLKNN